MHAVDPQWKWTIQKYPHYENVGVEDMTFEGKAKVDFTHHGSWEDDGAYKPINLIRLTNSWMRRVGFRSVSEAKFRSSTVPMYPYTMWSLTETVVTQLSVRKPRHAYL